MAQVLIDEELTRPLIIPDEPVAPLYIAPDTVKRTYDVIPRVLTEYLDGTRPIVRPDTSAVEETVPKVVFDPVDTMRIELTRYFWIMPARIYSMPVIFDGYNPPEPITLADAAPEGMDYYSRRIHELGVSERLYREAIYRNMYRDPGTVDYVASLLPVPPQHFHAVVEPTTGEVKLEPIQITPGDPSRTLGAVIKQRHWLHRFESSLQFSQAYISPNWYQGGSNNTNLVGNVFWNVKLNNKLHPNLTFETTVQYRVGVNSAPNDTVRNYNLSEDWFQINSNFGVKAVRNWSYSVSARLQTQLLNHYPTNGHKRIASLLSPGSANVGLGMTYNKNTKTVSLGISIAPLSYDLSTNIDRVINPEGPKTKSSYGSNTNISFNWKLRYNIRYSSRFYVYTDYHFVQADWTNNLSFNVTTYLQTQINCDLRYDTRTAWRADTQWHRIQLKELLSFGLNYQFKTA